MEVYCCLQTSQDLSFLTPDTNANTLTLSRPSSISSIQNAMKSGHSQTVYKFDKLYVDSRSQVFQDTVLPFIRSFFSLKIDKENVDQELSKMDLTGKDEYGLVLACGASGSGKVGP
jgi:hypothetical protein